MIQDNLKRGNLVIGNDAVYPLIIQKERTEKRHDPFGNSSPAALFHFAIWLEGNPHFTNFSISITVDSAKANIASVFSETAILFGNKRDRVAYKKWLTRYMKSFSDTDALIPRLPLSGQMKLTFAEAPRPEEEHHGVFPISESIAQKWAWISHNTRGRVFKTETGFAFTDSKSAIEFLLWNPN